MSGCLWDNSDDDGHGGADVTQGIAGASFINPSNSVIIEEEARDEKKVDIAPDNWIFFADEDIFYENLGQKLQQRMSK